MSSRRPQITLRRVYRGVERRCDSAKHLCGGPGAFHNPGPPIRNLNKKWGALEVLKKDEQTRLANAAGNLLTYVAFCLESGAGGLTFGQSPLEDLRMQCELAESVASTLQTFAKRWRAHLPPEPVTNASDEVPWQE